MAVPRVLRAARRRDRRDGDPRANFGTNPPQAKLGAQVTVLYEAGNPLNASLPAGGVSTLMSGVVIGIGVGLVTAAFLVLLL